MKQVEYISIGGYVFSLEDSASRAAKEYLDQLEAFYSRKESGAEVMEGIEERMAELLLEKSGKGGVVTLAMVNDVIFCPLGRPETIEEETSDAPDAEPAPSVRPYIKEHEQDLCQTPPQTLPRPRQRKNGRSLQWPRHLLQCGSGNIQNIIRCPDSTGWYKLPFLAA